MIKDQHYLYLGLLLSFFVGIPCFSQPEETEKKTGSSDRFYTTTGGEVIFSTARLKISGNEEGAVLRFSPVFNFQTFVHFDNGNGSGFLTGLTFRNVGLIYKLPDIDTKIKARTYNLGIPFAIKLGNMNGPFVYAGYEIELPLSYKEKVFINEKKEDTFSVWFSDRVNKFQHGLFAGIQLPYGSNIKFKYYLSAFYNKNYSESDGLGGRTNPYAGINAHIFYISLDFSLLRDDHFYYSKKVKVYTARR